MSFYLQTQPNFDIITDHKPLLGIFEKYIFEVDNPRLQRLREKKQAFSFQVKWVPGKLHLIADVLSLAPHFSPHADELSIETSFAVLSDQHHQCNQLLHCLAEHICPQYTDLLVQILSDFSSPAWVLHDRTMSLTKQLFLWHGILNDITTTINSCRACQLYVPSQKKSRIFGSYHLFLLFLYDGFGGHHPQRQHTTNS